MAAASFKLSEELLLKMLVFRRYSRVRSGPGYSQRSTVRN